MAKDTNKLELFPIYKTAIKRNQDLVRLTQVVSLQILEKDSQEKLKDNPNSKSEEDEPNGKYPPGINQPKILPAYYRKSGFSEIVSI